MNINKELKKTVCLIPTWLTARLALGAYNSFHKYYPDIPVYFADDEFVNKEQDRSDWNKIHSIVDMNAEAIWDPDSSKLTQLRNACYICGPHNGYETEGHGNAITYAMQFVHAKWVVHFTADARIIKPGLLETMFEGVDNKVCGIGASRVLDNELPNLNKWICIIRGDLYHKYNLDFHGDLTTRKLPMDAGTMYFTTLIEKGYKIKEINIDTLREYALHLRYKGDDKAWNEVF